MSKYNTHIFSILQIPSEKYSCLHNLLPVGYKNFIDFCKIQIIWVMADNHINYLPLKIISVKNCVLSEVLLSFCRFYFILFLSLTSPHISLILHTPLLCSPLIPAPEPPPLSYPHTPHPPHSPKQRQSCTHDHLPILTPLILLM